MTDAELYRVALDSALELPGSVAGCFSDGWEDVRVCGKWFALLTDHGGQLVNLKAEPDDVLELTHAYPSITPGYHMNKRHWVSLRAGEDLDEALVRRLVTDSYLLVVSKLPKRLRPVDPDSFPRG
ncbi:hypothetical protein HMPREF1008_01343 [Olsenella sp. oral taxon 809 str. F0356]|uniref:MmcQ/YjbR family DNA-binding protein n=1 Tax=Olsenella sp. oral taxon 809 TaxID=661086 RepID=UPI000231F1AD|nr:MmcQ/YjbR family DNA-binding protein [Olsenella sp. oral taxon 809]EHF01719.1 hypothetical protein HMPREF1008_01343 [Olsenella sp. oral taxon 809 str. F0356]